MQIRVWHHRNMSDTHDVLMTGLHAKKQAVRIVHYNKIAQGDINMFSQIQATYILGIFIDNCLSIPRRKNTTRIRFYQLKFDRN